jgi:hypothetical protein
MSRRINQHGRTHVRTLHRSRTANRPKGANAIAAMPV